jgi:23S rRNA (pseudouridine1915-N3)-methyltransferase
MRLLLIAVGRLKSGPARDLFEDYRGRLRPSLELIEVEERRPLPGPELMRREGELLLDALRRRQAKAGRPPLLIALDERGEALDTQGFARRYAAWRDRAAEEIAFVIGGADGLAPEVRAAADLSLSLGPMTWPHLLVRGLLAEQLYRAQQILAGHPYHRGHPYHQN